MPAGREGMVRIACFHLASFFRSSDTALLTGLDEAKMSSSDSPRSLVTPHFRRWASSLVSHSMKSTASLGWAAVEGTASALPPPNVTGGCPPASLDGNGATRQSVFGSLF